MLGMQLQNVARQFTGEAGEVIDIAALFSQSDSGCFYDLNDMSSLKSDIAGTTAASVDGPVGKILDKGADQDMVALVDTDRGTLRRKAKDTALRNKMQHTETTGLFSSSVNLSHSVSSLSSPLSYQSRKVHVATATGGGDVVAYAAIGGQVSSGTNQTISFYMKVTATGATPCEGIIFHNANGIGGVLFNFDTETVTGTNNDLVSGSMTAVANHTGWYRCVATVPAHGDPYFLIMTDGGSNFTGGVTTGNKFEVQGFQREGGSSATNYQVVYNYSYEEHGIANANYLDLTLECYVTQDMQHTSQDLIMFSRIDPAGSDSTKRPIFSQNRDVSDDSYRLSYVSNNFEFQVGTTSASSVQAAAPDNISTVRAEYIPASDTAKLYIDGTLSASNNSLNSQATDFGILNEASLGAQITDNGSTPTVNNKLKADLYSFVLFSKTLTDTQIKNIEYTLRSQSGDT